MKRKAISILSAFLATLLITSTVFAGAIKFSNVTFSLGTGTSGDSGGLMAMVASDASSEASSAPSLIAQGTMTGLGEQDVRVVLEASGLPDVTCTNQGGNQSPGQNPPKISISGEQLLFGFDLTRKNGKSPFGVETDAPPVLDAVEFGCPNENWSARIDFIHWEQATIRVLDLNTGADLAVKNYTCVTTLNNVTCTAVE